jgi:hypothetical protein
VETLRVYVDVYSHPIRVYCVGRRPSYWTFRDPQVVVVEVKPLDTEYFLINKTYATTSPAGRLFLDAGTLILQSLDSLWETSAPDFIDRVTSAQDKLGWNPSVWSSLLQYVGMKPAPRRPGNRILISRAGAANRRILNEADLLQALSPLGFERYRLETLPMEEQIALFQDAECVVAPHGAGLANLVFAPETAVVELFAADYIVPHYYLLCKAVGASYAAWNGSQSHHDEDVHANVSAICSLIESSFDKSRQVLTR